jgi:hypothetical protein
MLRYSGMLSSSPSNSSGWLLRKIIEPTVGAWGFVGLVTKPPPLVLLHLLSNADDTFSRHRRVYGVVLVEAYQTLFGLYKRSEADSAD